MKPNWSLYTDKNNPKGSESYGGGNPKCFYAENYEENDKVEYKGRSTSCSRDMAPVVIGRHGDIHNENICYWHWVRMAETMEIVCGCDTIFKVAIGDAIGRHILRTYLQNFSMPVIDLCGKLYCCGSCQNTDSEVATCGRMLVCEDCLSRHKNTTPISKEDRRRIIKG